MGHARPDSDLDIFAKDSPAFRESLEARGFKRITREGRPLDGNLGVIYRLGKVDVQLVRSLNTKIRANEMIKRNPLLRALDRFGSKMQRRDMWTRLQRGIDE
jgi:hypothetical protein